MPLPFARSERSLQVDDYRTAAYCLLLAAPLFIAWLWWFFGGDVALREVSLQMTRVDQDTVLATYDMTDLPDPRIGDDAQLRVRLSDQANAVILPAFISNVTYNADGTVDLHLFLEPEEGITVPEQLIGQAEVEIGTISPAAYVWQLANQP